MSANPSGHRHPAALSPEQVESLGNYIKGLEEALGPHLVTLTPEQRRTIRPLSDEQVAFMEEMFAHAKAHPDLVPDSVDMAKWERDITTFRVLGEISKHVHEVMDALEDRMLQVDPMSRFEAEDALRAAMSDWAPEPRCGDGRADTPPDDPA